MTSDTWWVLLFVLLGLCSSVLGCPGTCEADVAACLDDGGLVREPCGTKEFCCEKSEEVQAIVGSCNSVKSKGSAPFFVFQSPMFPFLLQRDLVCPFTVELEEDIAGILLEFDVFHSDGVRLGKKSDNCDQDMLFIRGFGAWAPNPICGEFSGYTMVIDNSRLKDAKVLTLLAVMASPNFRWSIKITQMKLNQCPSVSPLQPPPTTPAEAAPASSRNSGRVSQLATYGYNAPAMRLHVRRRRSLTPNDIKLIPLMEDGQSPVTPSDEAQKKSPWIADIRRYHPSFGRQKQSQESSNTSCDLGRGLHSCAGAIISDREIVTAAYCFFVNTKLVRTVPIKTLRVYLDDPDWCTSEGTHSETQVYGVDSVILHYNYDDRLLMDDIAIIRLNSTIEFNERIKPIQLSDPDEDLSGNSAFISGWSDPSGLNQFMRRSMTRTLQYSDNVKFSDQNKCSVSLLRSLGVRPQDLMGHEKYHDLLRSVKCIEKKNADVEDEVLSPGELGSPVGALRPDAGEAVLTGIMTHDFGIDHRGTEGGGSGSWLEGMQSVQYFRHWIDTARCLTRDSRQSQWLVEVPYANDAET